MKTLLKHQPPAAPGKVVATRDRIAPMNAGDTTICRAAIRAELRLRKRHRTFERDVELATKAVRETGALEGRVVRKVACRRGVRGSFGLETRPHIVDAGLSTDHRRRDSVHANGEGVRCHGARIDERRDGE